MRASDDGDTPARVPCLHGFELLLSSDLLATWDAEFEWPNCTPFCDIAWRRLRSSRTCFATSAAGSSTAVTTLQARSLQISPFCTDTPRSKNGARTASRLPSKDRVGSSAPSQFHRDEIAGCLNGPVYQPDEEHATARRRPRRDACPRIAAVPRPPCSQSKSRDKEHCLFGKRETA
jgi:hypothetical protein